MKKLFNLILLLLFVLTLVSCKEDEEIVEVDPFDVYQDVLSNYQVENTFGVKVEVKQYLNGVVIHHQLVEQFISRGGSPLGKTYYYEQKVGPFDVDSEYVETEVTTYYQDGQMISEIEGSALSYETVTFEEYVDGEMLLKGLTKDNFVEYVLEDEGTIHTLTGVLTIGSVRSIFGTDISMVIDNELTVKIDEETGRLLEFLFVYTSEHTRTSFRFTPSYEAVEIVFPVGE